MIAPALSVTHQHLLSVVATEFVRPAAARPVRILDAGCGDGLLLDYFAQNMGKIYPGVTFEFYGFDVSDHRVQAPGYFQDTVAILSRNHPYMPWSERLALISESDAWPWPPDQFDVIISNQVMEHVRNHRLFFSEIFRTLRPDGFSVHVFPLRHVLVEPHLHLPLVHRIRNRDLLRRSIHFLSRLGLGKYDPAQESLDSYAERHAAYLLTNVNYLTSRNVLKLAAESELHADFRYTPQYYLAKLRAILSRAPTLHYRRGGPQGGDKLASALLKYLASVTLVVVKQMSPAGTGRNPKGEWNGTQYPIKPG